MFEQSRCRYALDSSDICHTMPERDGGIMSEFLSSAVRRLHVRTVLQAAALAAASLTTACGGGDASSGGGSGPPSGPTGTPTPTPPAIFGTAKAMIPGINLGNSLEAVNGTNESTTTVTWSPPFSTSQETWWGNPVVTQAVFDGYAAAGFKSVRIPVAWAEYTDSSGNISPVWLARVGQVVTYARNAGLYAIINIHWDGGWVDAQPALQATVQARMTNYWTQIANYFNSYDDHLIFAGMNEINNTTLGQNTPGAADCATEQSYNQTFVNAVRATGGNNATRPLMVQAYLTSINYGLLCNATMPTDTASNALMLEIHYYDPYDFTLNNSSSIWQWGASATIPSATETWANESYVDAQFAKMQTTFVNNNVPVIMGEYGAYDKLNFSTNPATETFPGMLAYTRAWDKYVTVSAVQHGITPIFWDAGGQLGLINRSTGQPGDATTLTTIVNAAQGALSQYPVN